MKPIISHQCERASSPFATPALLLLFHLVVACTSSNDLVGPSGMAGTTSAGGSGNGAAGAGAVGGGGTSAGAGGSAAGAAGASGGSPDLGVPVIPYKAIHRLSNVEYDNTLRVLTRTESSYGDRFVKEEAEGFDNIATALSISPRQFEDYFTVARELSSAIFADPTLRAGVVSCDPVTDSSCAARVITDFGKRAFRRPLEATESASLLEKYRQALALGTDALGALQHVVQIMLASPQFLYRIEFDPDVSDATPHPVSAYELASRLSYALWSSMPDDALFARAESGELLQPESLTNEVDRMLADPQAEMLVKNFAAQWFGSQRLSEHVASPTAFTTWSSELAASMQREMELYFSEFLHGDLSYADFLTADVNFVDQRLAAHYGMVPPSGTAFQRVVDTSDRRQGFLGLAGFLTHTSRETRSSPIIRGKWILNSVWCFELRLPTNIVVEPLPEPAEGAPPTSVREQMELHSADDTCAGCHSAIDPVGLSLEHFDGIGRYRETYEDGLPIDSMAELPDGQVVDGLATLSAVLAQDPQVFSCAANKFGTYALGLTMANANRDQIAARWVAGTPTLRNLLKETVRHEMFRMRSAEEP